MSATSSPHQKSLKLANYRKVNIVNIDKFVFDMNAQLVNAFSRKHLLAGQRQSVLIIAA